MIGLKYNCMVPYFCELFSLRNDKTAAVTAANFNEFGMQHVSADNWRAHSIEVYLMHYLG